MEGHIHWSFHSFVVSIFSRRIYSKITIVWAETAIYSTSFVQLTGFMYQLCPSLHLNFERQQIMYSVKMEECAQKIKICTWKKNCTKLQDSVKKRLWINIWNLSTLNSRHIK